MALSVDGTNITSVNIDGVSIYELQLDGKTMWCKPFTLSISKGTGVSSVTVKRTVTKEPSASLVTLSNGSTVYYGDQLNVTATASSGYVLDGSIPYDVVVSSSTTISVTATKTLSKPEITLGYWGYDADGGRYTCYFDVKNTNNVSVEMSVKLTAYVDNDGNTEKITSKMIDIVRGGGFDSTTSTKTLTSEETISMYCTSWRTSGGTITTMTPTRTIKMECFVEFNGGATQNTAVFENPNYEPYETTTTTTTTPSGDPVILSDTQGDWELYVPANYKRK